MTGPVADEFDLTPSPSRPESSGRRAVPVLVVLLVVAAIVGVLVKTLGDATLVFHGVDARSLQIGQQGTAVSVAERSDSVIAVAKVCGHSAW